MDNIKFKIISKNLITVTYEKNAVNFDEIINFLNLNTVKIKDISTDDGDLEDVFVQLTKHQILMKKMFIQIYGISKKFKTI